MTRTDEWFARQDAHALAAIAQCEVIATPAQVQAAAAHLEPFGYAWLRTTGLLDDAPVQLDMRVCNESV